MASLILKKNLLPSGGSCIVDQTNGTSLLTVFNIICQNWVDLDGSVNIYEYMGKNFKNVLYKKVHAISPKKQKIISPQISPNPNKAIKKCHQIST